MKDMIILAERDKDNEKPLIMENVKKTVMAEVVKV